MGDRSSRRELQTTRLCCEVYLTFLPGSRPHRPPYCHPIPLINLPKSNLNLCAGTRRRLCTTEATCAKISMQKTFFPQKTPHEYQWVPLQHGFKVAISPEGRTLIRLPVQNPNHIQLKTPRGPAHLLYQIVVCHQQIPDNLFHFVVATHVFFFVPQRNSHARSTSGCVGHEHTRYVLRGERGEHLRHKLPLATIDDGTRRTETRRNVLRCTKDFAL